MFAQVRKEVSSCTMCDRVKANFEVKDSALGGELTCVRCHLSRYLGCTHHWKFTKVYYLFHTYTVERARQARLFSMFEYPVTVRHVIV
jgi:hypothetical protein